MDAMSDQKDKEEDIVDPAVDATQNAPLAGWINWIEKCAASPEPRKRGQALPLIFVVHTGHGRARCRRFRLEARRSAPKCRMRYAVGALYHGLHTLAVCGF